MAHVERKCELRRRRARRAKIRKLRAKLEKAKNQAEVEQILAKIKKISPFWSLAEVNAQKKAQQPA
jgi:hypothetical protein